MTTGASVLADSGLVLTGVICLAALLGGYLMTLDWWQRVYSLTLLLLIGGSSSIPTLAAASFYPRYVAAAILVVLTLRGTAGRLATHPRSVRRFIRAMYLLTAIAAASTLWSFTPAVTAQQAVALLILAALLHLLVTRRWTDRTLIGSDMRVAYVVLIAATVASLIAVRLGVAGAAAANGRLQGVFGNPNTLATAAGLAIPLSWAIYKNTGKARYLVLAVFPILAVFESGSRTALLASLAGAAWIALRHIASRPSVLVPITVAVMFVLPIAYLAGVSFVGLGAVERLDDTEGGLLNSRTLAWQAAVDLWLQRPVGGWGYQAGEAAFAAHHGLVGFLFTRTAAHNSSVQMLLELGILGVLVMVFLVGIVLVSLFRAPSAGPTSGLAGVVVAGLVIQQAESAAFGTGQVYPFVFWFAATAIVLAAGDNAIASRSGGRPGSVASVRSGASAISAFSDRASKPVSPLP